MGDIDGTLRVLCEMILREEMSKKRPCRSERDILKWMLARIEIKTGYSLVRGTRISPIPSTTEKETQL